MYKRIVLLVGMGVLLCALPATADPVTIHYVVLAPGFFDHGVYHVTNEPGSFGVASFGGFQDTIVPFNLTLQIAPLPAGATLISAWVAAQPDWIAFANGLTVVQSGVTPVSAGTFQAAEWNPGACVGESQADVSVGGTHALDGTVVYEDIAATFGAQLAAGTTIQAIGWVGCGGRSGAGFPFPGFNANTEFTWDVNVPYPVLLSVDITYEPAPVPEPGTLSLFGLGLLGIGRAAARKIRKPLQQ